MGYSSWALFKYLLFWFPNLQERLVLFPIFGDKYIWAFYGKTLFTYKYLFFTHLFFVNKVFWETNARFTRFGILSVARFVPFYSTVIRIHKKKRRKAYRYLIFVAHTCFQHFMCVYFNKDECLTSISKGSAPTNMSDILIILKSLRIYWILNEKYWAKRQFDCVISAPSISSYAQKNSLNSN